MDEKLLTISEVAQMIRRSERTVLRMIEKGLLQNRRIGHIHYVRREWVDEWFNNLPDGIRHREKKA